MFLASPWWLAGLLPWAIISLWLLWGKRKRTLIPFIELWRMPPEVQATRRSLQMPLPIAACIAAMGLAILAAARPGLQRPETHGSSLTILVDRGLAMSAQGRYENLVRQASSEITAQFGPGPVDLILLPGPDPIQTTRAEWSHKALEFPPTALDTRPALQSALADRLARDSAPVLVLTDQSLETHNNRLVRIAPPTPAKDVSILRFAARDLPAGQVMVTLQNHTNLSKARLRITSDHNQLPIHEVDLPPAGQERNYFFDLQPGRILSAQLEADDELSANNRAFLVQQGLWPKVEPRTPLPPPVQRLIEDYSLLRPPTSSSPRIAAVSSVQALPLNEPAVAFVGTGQTNKLGKLTITDHPITQHIETWPDWGLPLADPGWTPIVYGQGEALVAIRTTPVRQAYVGLDLDDWSRSPQFVIFMSNLLDWLGEGKHEFASSLPEALPRGWVPIDPASMPPNLAPGLWPGIYRAPDGRLKAINAPNLSSGIPAGDWRKELKQAAVFQARQHPAANLSGPLILLALSCLALAAATWRSRPSKGPLRIAGLPVATAEAD